MNINKTGIWGEQYCARYLRKKGYHLLESEYRCRMGEIDIIAEKDGVTCFIEVKTRGENPLFRPMESVDFHKRKRLIGAAQYYMRYIGKESASRFDVMEVTVDENNNLKHINHIKDAFDTLD